jgi:hypothetical protein
MDAKHIAHSVSLYWQKKLYVVNHEVGLCKHGRLRADLIATNMGLYIILVEVKSSVADFRTDKKWHKYLPFSNKTYFAMAPEVYEKVKDQIPKGIGIFLVYPSGHTKIKGRAHHREVDAAVKLNIAARLVYRSGETLHERKSKTAGAQLVAETAVTAIQAIPKEQRKGNRALVVAKVKEAISKYVK